MKIIRSQISYLSLEIGHRTPKAVPSFVVRRSSFAVRRLRRGSEAIGVTPGGVGKSLRGPVSIRHVVAAAFPGVGAVPSAGTNHYVNAAPSGEWILTVIFGA